MTCMLKVIHYCLQMYLKLLSAPGLAWQTCLKKTKVEIELLTNIDMLLMAEKAIRGGIYQAIHRYTTSNEKYMKNYEKTLHHHISCIYMRIICMDGQCLKNFL